MGLWQSVFLFIESYKIQYQYFVIFPIILSYMELHPDIKSKAESSFYPSIVSWPPQEPYIPVDTLLQNEKNHPAVTMLQIFIAALHPNAAQLGSYNWVYYIALVSYS